MDIIKYLSLLVVFFCDVIESGGHGGSHDHIKLYVPEYHHHKHHTKYITIHHHHKKPKKEHHHHHIHIPKSHPHHHYGHYHRTKKGHKTTLKTTTTHVGSGLGHGGHGHHGHLHHGHGHHHHDASTSYDPPVYDDHYNPSVSHAPSPIAPVASVPHIPSSPKVHGISHTVKQVKVFDSLPGALPGANGGKGYEVTENADDEDDHFTSVNDLHNAYPSTFNFIQSASGNTGNNGFGLTGHSHNTDPFGSSEQAAVGADSYSGLESFAGTSGGQELSSLAGHNGDFQPISHEIPVNFATGNEKEAFDGAENSFTSGTGLGQDAYLSGNEKFGFEDTPVTFSREAGVQRTENTGSQQTVVY